MKPRKVLIKVIGFLHFLFMLSLISCEKQDCKICEDGNGDTMEACTDGQVALAYFLGYYNCY
ncbi:MAG: hypothetical protein WCD55_08605 [Bacteroidales bacterium]